MPDDERAVIFNDLLPGRYKVSAVLKGHRPDAQESLVQRGKSDKLDLKLEPITHNLTIVSNFSSGMVKYSTGNAEADVKPFEGDSLTLSGLVPGRYDVELMPNDASYQPLRTSVNVPAPGDRLNLPLENKLSEKEFSWGSLSDWTLPGEWKVNSKRRLVIKGRGLAVPSDGSFLHYKDFELTSDVMMANGVAVSFVVRAKDAKNFYLIQLTGEKATDRYVLRGFIVKDGVESSFGRTTPISQFADAIKQDKFFRVKVSMTGTDIDVKVEDTATGDLLPLGKLSDASNTYRIGAVGLVARDNEQNEVGLFTVAPKSKSGRSQAASN